MRTPGTVELQPRKSARRTDFFKMWLICAKWASFLQNAGAQALWRIRTRHFGRPKSPKCPLKSPDCAAKAPECGADFSFRFLQSAHLAEKRGAGFRKSRVFVKTPAQVLKMRARRFGETGSVAVCRKGPAALGKRAAADGGIQSGADLRTRALRSA